MLRIPRTAACLLVCLALSACFRPGDPVAGQPDAGESSAGRGGGGGGAAGGSAGGFGTPPSPGFGGSAGGSVVVSCDGVECASGPGTGMLAGLVQPCCTFAGSCSLQMPGSPSCPELPESDPRCGAVQVGTGELPGCCLDDGTCGANVETLGFGCVGASLLASFGLMVEQRACMDAGLPPPDAGAGGGDDAGL